MITNSETRCGATAITPRIVFQVCDNDYTITTDAHRAVHLGGKLEQGVIDWSGTTHQKNLELITAKTTDAVRRFLTPAYVQKVVTTMEAKTDVPVEHPAETIQVISQQLRFSTKQQDAILGHFIKSGDLTTGGVMHAVTSTARTLPDADTAHEMESRTLQVLQLAART